MENKKHNRELFRKYRVTPDEKHLREEVSEFHKKTESEVDRMLWELEADRIDDLKAKQTQGGES